MPVKFVSYDHWRYPMKKLLSLTFVCLLCTALLLPVGAKDWVSDTFTSTFDAEPSWYDDAVVVEFEDYYEEGVTNARAGDTYVFLKNDGKGDFSIEFEVDEDGIYDIGVTLMGWTKSVPRSTNFTVDGAPNIYMMFDYEDDSTQKIPQYLTGAQMELKAGKHTFTLSLAADFDDNTVKSLYCDNFFYHKASDIPVETEAPETVEETVAETVAVEARTVAAPQTMDAGVFAVIAMVTALGGYAASKKR